MNYSPKKMQNLLDKHAFHFKKQFGQNFIIDENLIHSILEKSKIDSETLVIEIGPGAGSLTYGLSMYAKNVLCYEIDKNLKNILDENLKDISNVDVIYTDFLCADVNNDIRKYDFQKLYIVANLPYYITTPIVMKIIESNIPVDKIVIMVQKEVGNRFNAKPNTKDYNSLSVYLNYYFNIKKLVDVSRNVFVPKPNVDSIVVELSKKDEKIHLENESLFFKLVRDSFTQKRKTIRNNLKMHDLSRVEEVLKKYNLDLSVRAEQLSIDIFAEIANNLNK